MEENNKKKCPFCGAEINEQAKKCRFCGNWIDEEIPCPYCAEKIKASAKKCRFCGEWINNEENHKVYNSFFSDLLCKIKNKWLIFSIILIITLLVSLCVIFATYVPNCKNSGIQTRLKDYIISNYHDISDVMFDKESAHKIKRIEKGYSCSINATINETPTQIEYNYKKISFNEFDMNAKFVLPNCFDASVKSLLSDLIKDTDLYGIKNNTSDVITQYEKQEDYDKESVSYTCSADAILTSKPGKAYLLSIWDYDKATRKIKCKVTYKSFFCKNGYTTCVGLSDLYACGYEED